MKEKLSEVKKQEGVKVNPEENEFDPDLEYLQETANKDINELKEKRKEYRATEEEAAAGIDNEEFNKIAEEINQELNKLVKEAGDDINSVLDDWQQAQEETIDESYFDPEEESEKENNITNKEDLSEPETPQNEEKEKEQEQKEGNRKYNHVIMGIPARAEESFRQLIADFIKKRIKEKGLEAENIILRSMKNKENGEFELTISNCPEYLKSDLSDYVDYLFNVNFEPNEGLAEKNNEEKKEEEKDSITPEPRLDEKNKKENLPETPQNKGQEVSPNQTQTKVDDYRAHLENIKIKEGDIKGAEFRELAYVQENLKSELEKISELLLAGKVNKNEKEDIVNMIAEKVGLSIGEINEIYQQQDEVVKNQARAEISQKSGKIKRIAWAAARSICYAGAGAVSASLSFGTLGVVGIAAARIVDRTISEIKLKNQIAEIKKEKSKDQNNLLDLQNKFASAVSLRKKININSIKIGDQAFITDNIISEYVDEQSAAGLIEVPKEDLPAYKEKLTRALSGLHQLDQLNDQREKKMNNSGIFNKIKGVEELVSGRDEAEKIVSTSVFVGLGLVAREVPILRNILTGYAGWKIGGVAADMLWKKFHKEPEEINPNDLEEITSIEQYDQLKKLSLDHNLQVNNPEGWLKIKQVLDEFENTTNPDALINWAHINKDDVDKPNQMTKLDKAAKTALRVSGALLGVAVGEMAHSILPKNHPSGSHSTSSHSTNNYDQSIGRHGQENYPSGGGQENHSGSFDNGSGNIPKPGTNPASKNFEDLISNENLKPGQHDTVWRSTDQIFKDHAKELGYKGDPNNQKELEAWANSQTAKAINHSGPMTDKVFEGNKVVLHQDAKGNFNIEVEKGKGFDPGQLDHPKHNSSISTEEVGSHKTTHLDMTDDKSAGDLEKNIHPQSAPRQDDTLFNQKTKNNIETPDSSKTGTKVSEQEIVTYKKTLSSFDNFKNAPDKFEIKIGELVMTKHGSRYYVETKDGENFEITFNKYFVDDTYDKSDMIAILKQGQPLDIKSFNEEIRLKTIVYDNLPDKRTSFAKGLLKEIQKNKKETEFLQDFKF